MRERVALVAHGGYGRRQQAPYSDVDLMVLYDGRPDTLIKQLAARLTQDISDVGLALGHSLRTPSEAVQLWENMAAAGGGQQPPEWASTHPSRATRKADLTAGLPAANALRDAARRAGRSPQCTPPALAR